MKNEYNGYIVMDSDGNIAGIKANTLEDGCFEAPAFFHNLEMVQTCAGFIKEAIIHVQSREDLEQIMYDLIMEGVEFGASVNGTRNKTYIRKIYLGHFAKNHRLAK